MQQNQSFTSWWHSPRIRDIRQSVSPSLWLRRLTIRHRRLPDFIIPGAQKAGTTSLFGWLQQHPQCAPSLKKEVHFFDRHFQRGPNWYRTNFPLCLSTESDDGEKLSFESSPYYMFDPRVPARAHEVIPDAKVIFLLRDPVKRAYSHYQHSVRRRRETLSFEEAIAAEPTRLAGEEEKLLADTTYQSTPFRHFSYLARGMYAEQLSRWLEYFPMRQLLVIESEQMFCHPRIVYQRIVDFLEIEPWQPTEFGNLNTGRYRSKMLAETQRRLAAHFAPHNERLFELLGTRFAWCRPSDCRAA
jgi:hypothetical protein